MQSQDTLYNNLEDTPIKVFYDILNTGNYELLGKHDEPFTIWLEMYNDYCIKSKIDTGNIKQMAKVKDLEIKYSIVLELLEKLRYTYYLKEIEAINEVFLMVVDSLRKKGYLFNSSKPFSVELERLLKQSDSLKMKITIEETKIKKTDKKVAVNVWKELVTLERVTNIKLNPNTDVIAKLLEVRELANEIIKQKKAA